MILALQFQYQSNRIVGSRPCELPDRACQHGSSFRSQVYWFRSRTLRVCADRLMVEVLTSIFGLAFKRHSDDHSGILATIRTDGAS